MRLVSALCIVLSLTTAAAAQNLTTSQILAKLDEKAKVFKSLDANITMEQVLSGVKRPPETGKIYIKMGKTAPMVLFDITAPKKAAKTALVKDDLATLYFREQKNYQQGRVGPGSNAFQLLLTGFGVTADTLKKYYTPEAKGRETLNGVVTEVLDLTLLPGQGGDFSKVTLWLDPKAWTPVQIRLTHKDTSTTTYKYSNVRLNSNMSDSVFKLDIPKDAIKQ